MGNPEIFPPVLEDRGARKLGWAPVFLIVFGVAVICGAAFVESQRVNKQPWALGVFVPEGDPELDDAVIVRSRRIPPGNFDSLANWIERNYPEAPRDPGVQELIDNVRDREQDTERVIYAPLFHEEMQPLLASGRMPEPGKPEVLAGPLVRVHEFEMDGVSFHVTGEISPLAGLFLNGCLLPEDDTFNNLFTDEHGAATGWIHRDGIDRLMIQRTQELDAQAENTTSEPQSPKPDQPEFIGGAGMTGNGTTSAGILGLGLAGCGGALAFTRLLRICTRRANPLIAPLLDEIALRPRLWFGLHAAFYGTFLLTMFLALRYPAWNMTLTRFVAQIFTEGELSFIGQAYASENIARAALATFYHNYVTATLLLTLAVSLIVPGAGVLKTWTSFAFMGFAMSPLWTGTLSAYTYHSLTMVMEFEAYILASFAAAVYAVRVASGLFRGNAPQGFARGLRVMLGAAVLSGCILAAAALYEAVTLLTLR